MKKIKILTPMLSLTAIGGLVAPLTTSCATVETIGGVIPTDLLDIVGYTLKGFKSDVDVSKYSVLSIPEGVKYIDNNAFENAFVTGAKSGVIKTVIMPTTLREIRKNAFKGCSSLRVLDFSAWDHDQIHYLTCADGDGEGAFIGTSKIGAVLLNDNITEESKDKLQSLLTSSTLDAAWFAEFKTDKISPDEAWKVQKKENGKNAKYLFSVNVDLKGANLYAQVTRTDGTSGVDVTCGQLVQRDTNVYELPVSLLNKTADGDYADFTVTFMAAYEPEAGDYQPIWQEVLTGFTLTNVIKEGVTYVDEINLTAESTSVKIGDTLQVNAEVLPATATEKSVEWSSSDDSIATVDADGKVTGVAAGDVTITASAKDGGGTIGTIDLKVKVDGIELASFDKDQKTFYTTDVTELATKTKYTFVINGSADTEKYYPLRFVWTDKSGGEPTNSVIDDESLTFTYIKTGSEPVSFKKNTHYYVLTYANVVYVDFYNFSEAVKDYTLGAGCQLVVTASFEITKSTGQVELAVK